MSYQALISRIAPEANARHVEAWMRLEFATLDDLSVDRFRVEVRNALACIAAAGEEQSEKLAASCGKNAFDDGEAP